MVEPIIFHVAPPKRARQFAHIRSAAATTSSGEPTITLGHSHSPHQGDGCGQRPSTQQTPVLTTARAWNWWETVVRVPSRPSSQRIASLCTTR
jgi:hypothetical protein